MAQLPAQCADGDILFRKITTDDFKTLMKDIQDDPAHNQQPGFNPELFMDPETQGVAFQDECGEVVFWANFSREIRVRIQFRKDVDKEKVREAFTKYIPLFAENFKRAGCKAFLFDSVSAPLIWFLRRFGFRKAASEYRREL